MNRSTFRAAALPCALVLVLAGCSGNGDADPAVPEPVTVTVEAPAAGGGDGTTGEGDEETAEVVEPAEERTIEVNEVIEYAGEDSAYTFTLQRVVIHDYYVEADVTLVNDGTRDLGVFSQHSGVFLKLYDDRGRTYEWVPPAGADSMMTKLVAGEGMNVTHVFAGRLSPQARSLTLDFSEATGLGAAKPYRDVVIEIPVTGAP